MANVFAEAIVVGLVFVVIGLIVGAVVHKIVPSAIDPEFQKACAVWNKHHVMELTLFATGVIGHFLFEMIGANKWYCSHGAACQK